MTGMLFSKRLSIAEKAEEWCKQRGAPLNAFNIVTALENMNFLNLTEDQQKELNEWRKKRQSRCRA